MDIRLRNAARSGDCNPVNKKTIYSAGLIECLKRGKELFGWDERKAEALATRGDIRQGVGVACFSYSSNTYPVGVEIASARLLMNQDGNINVQVGATEIGQGSDTVFSQMVAETLGVPVSTIQMISTQDTDITPFDPAHSRHGRVMSPHRH